MQVQSIETQKEWTQKTSAILGKTIGKVYIDTKSAKHPNNRPAFTQMMKDIKAGKWEGVFAYTVNRIARNIPEGSDFCYVLQMEKIKELVTTQSIFTPDTDTISIMLHIAQSVQFSRDLSKVTKAGQNRKAEKMGKWMWRAPAGYINVMDPRTREKFVETDEMYPIMVKVLKMVFNGMSIAEAWDKSYEMGLRTRPTKNFPEIKRISRAGFYKIFEERSLYFYAGMVRDTDGNIFQGEHKPAVTIKEVQNYLGKERKAHVRSEIYFPFRKLIKCGECGCGITSMIQKGHIYYNCGKKRGSCSQKYTREEALNEKFQELLSDYEISNELIQVAKKTILSSGNANKNIVKDDNKLIFDQINKLEEQKENLVLMRSKNEISFEQMKKAEEKIEKQDTDLRKRLEKNQSFTGRQVEVANNWFELLKNLSGSYKTQHLQEKAYLLKMFGLNFVLRDEKLACEEVNQIFLPPSKSSKSIVVSQSRPTLNQYIDIVYKNIDEIEIILKRLSMA